MLDESNKSHDLQENQSDKSISSELFDKVISAIHCSFNSNTTNQEKQNALKYLEDLKENHSMICLTISFELLKQLHHPSILHHYSLHIIESMIKSKWNLLKNDERYLIKKQLFFIIKSSYLNQTFTDPIYIRNSLAKCLVELIKRDCFEKVNTTFDEIVNIIQGMRQIEENNSTQLELILLVYRYLNEELTIYAQSIQAQRRRQIVNQIQKRLNDILPCLIRLSNDLLNKSNHSERLTQTCLLTMNSFLSWVEYHHFEQYEFFLCELFLKFFQLNSIKIRHASFECLLTLVNKRLARKQLQQQQQQRNKRIASTPLNCEQEKIFLNYLLGDQTLEMFYRLLINPTESIEELRMIVTGDHINCLKMFGQFLLKLSNYFLQLFHQLSTKSIDNNDFLLFINERTNSFFQYLLLLNQHPFHLLSLNSYQALNLFLIRQPILLSNHEFCLKFIFNLKQSLHRIHFPSTSTMRFDENEHEIFRKQSLHNQQCCIYVLFEYDSEEQFFWKFFSQYRSELQKLIKSFVGLFFIETNQDRIEMNMTCLRTIVENLFVALETLVQRTPDKPLNSLSSIYLIIEWEACYLLLDHILFILRKELFSTSSSTMKFQSLFLIPSMTTLFLHVSQFLLQFTPNFSEHIHGHVLNLLSCLFFISQHDQNLSIAIIQRLLSTFQHYQEQSIVGRNAHQCEVIQSQSSNAFLYLCRNFPKKLFEYYSELFPFLCRLYQNEFQSMKTIVSMVVDEQTSPTLKLLDAAQMLFYEKFSDQTVIENQHLEDFYQLVKPIYEIFNVSLTAQSVGEFIDYLDLCSNQNPSERYRRRNLMLALHCLCLLLRFSKQEQGRNVQLHSKITLSLRPIFFDFILKMTQFCNQLYDPQINPYYERLKSNLTYSETEKQLYLGTYESNNMFKATITSTPVSYNRSPSSSSNPIIDDQRLRDYLHRLFDICYQIHGMYFSHDHDLYYLKFAEENYFLTSYLQKILFENFQSLPSIRLRIILRHSCRLFVENYCSSTIVNQDAVNELFLSFLNVFLPYIQQRLTLMWNHLLTNNTVEQNECSEEVIEECVCVLITRDFNDIIRYFIFKTIPGQTSVNRRKNKATNDRESMSEDANGDFEQNEEWDEGLVNNNLNSKFSNAQEKMDYSDLFTYMMKMARQDSPSGLSLFSQVIRILFECLTFPDAYCINRFLPIILPLTRLYTDIFDKHPNHDSLVDIKYLFRCLLKALERHNENESVNTNLISLVGHVYELWFNQYSQQLDTVFHETIPQLNIEGLNGYKTRLSTNNKKQAITERERRDTIRNLLSPILLSPISNLKKDGGNATNPLSF